MPRLEVPQSALGANTLDVAGTALVQADGGVITVLPDDAVLRVANTSGLARNLTVKGKLKSATINDQVVIALGIGETRWIRLSGARLMQTDGTIQIDVDGTGVQVRLFNLAGAALDSIAAWV